MLDSTKQASIDDWEGWDENTTSNTETAHLCPCGCGGRVKKGNTWFKRGCSRRGKKMSAACIANISKALQGKKMGDAFKEKCRSRMVSRWQDPAYHAEMCRMSTEVNADPAMRLVHSNAVSAWITAHPEHLKHLAEVNVKWALEHPEKKIEAAKKGHMALAVQGKRSSIEIKLERALQKAGVPFYPQWEHTLGVADFLVPPNIVVFADGDYWHGSKKAQEKDARHNESLTNQGYRVLRFWEHAINKDVQACVNQVQTLLAASQIE